MAILDFLKPQLVDATAPRKNFSNKTSCTFLESSTKTLLKEVKHVVSVKHEYWNWDEPWKVILLVRKVEFSKFRGRYPKRRLFEKIPFNALGTFNWDLEGAVRADFPVKNKNRRTKSAIFDSLFWNFSTTMTLLQVLKRTMFKYLPLYL